MWVVRWRSVERRRIVSVCGVEWPLGGVEAFNLQDNKMPI